MSEVAYADKPRKPGGYPEWTPERFGRAKEMYLAGMDEYKIAREIGALSGPSVRSKMVREGVKRKQEPRWTDENIAELTRLWADGLSGTEVAAALFGSGELRSAVIGKVHRLKLPAREPRKPARRTKRNNPFGRKPLAARLQSRSRLPPTFVRPLVRSDFLGIPFADLKANHCRYPSDSEPFTYCGQPRLENSSYCAYCHSVCHQ